MRKKIINNEYTIVLVFLLLICLVTFYPNIFQGKDFVWYNDQQFQHSVFYHEYHRIIRESFRNLYPSFFSWDSFLGSDFFTSKLFYCIGDFIALPILLIFRNINFDLFFCFETIICIILSGLLFLNYLKIFGIQSKKVRMSFAILYALSGFVILFSGSYMFHRFYAFLPLLFISVEKYINNGKVSLMALSVFILFAQNFELLFATSFFLILYYIFSYKLKNSKQKLSKVVISAVPLIGGYLLGIIMSSIMLIPLFLYIKSNPRVGTLNYGDFFWSLKEFISYVFSFFTVPFNFRTDIPPYPFYTRKHFGMEFNNFATCVVLLVNIYILNNKNLKERKLFLSTELIASTFILVRPLNMIMHGFSVPTFRFSFLVMILNIIISAYIIDNYDYKSFFNKINCVTVFVFLLICLAIKKCDIDFNTYKFSMLIMFIFYLFIYLYDYAWRKSKEALLKFMVINISVAFVYSIYSMQKTYPNSEPALNTEYVKYFQDTDDSLLFRYYINPEIISPFSSLNLNASLIYDYKSTYTYDSSYEAVLSNFLINNGYQGWVINIDKPELLKMLGVKYYGVIDEKDLPSEFEYEYAYNLDNLKMYLIKDYHSIGHTYSNFIAEKYVDYDNFDWDNNLIIADKDMQKIADIKPSHKQELQITSYDRHSLNGNINVNSKQVLFISIPYNEGWEIKNQNNENLKKIKVQDGFMGIIIDQNTQEIHMKFLPYGFKFGSSLSIIGFLLYFLILKKEKQYLIK